MDLIKMYPDVGNTIVENAQADMIFKNSSNN